MLLLAGVAVNLWLAWDAGREDVATLHGVLSLVALAVLPREFITLAAAAGVTVFSIFITYRQRWKYQLLLTILSFFAFHQYWHYARETAGMLATGPRLTAMALVLAVGAAGAVVQYRRVYAQQRFDALLFSAHVLNWTCLGINLYQYSTGSPWKTVPLALGALLTFGVARQARRLGIGWLFRTDSLISLMLALFAAFSLQGWHASGTLIFLFMLLETLLVAFVMAREGERLVFQVASIGAVAAGLGLVGLNLFYLTSYSAAEVPRNALLLLLAGLLGAGYYHLLRQAPLLTGAAADRHQQTTRVFGGVVGLLYLGAAALLAQAIFGFAHPPLPALLGGTLAAAGAVFGGAWYLRGTGGWFHTLHLLSGQALLIVFVLGLHETGLGWPATFTILYFETLLLAGACGWVAEKLAYRILMGLALASGATLLVAAVGSVRELAAPVLHQRLTLLLLTGLGSAALLLLPTRRPSLRPLLANPDDQLLFQALRGLTVLFYVSGIGLLTQALFGLPHPPLPALLGATTAAAGLTFGLAYWVRAQTDWFRLGLILLGQTLLLVFILGLHEAGLSWPAATTLLYFETLLLAGAFGLAAEQPAYRLLLGVALGSGVALLLVAVGSMRELAAPMLHQRLYLLLLTSLGSAALLLLPARWPVARLLPTNQPDQTMHQTLRGLTVLFYLSGIGLLTQALFGLQQPPVELLLGAATVSAGFTFGLAYWVKGQADWFRSALLLLGQGLLVVFVLGLHEAGLSWPAATALLYFEMLTLTLLLAWRAEPLYRALLVGSLVLAVALPALVYRPGNLPDYQRAALLLMAALGSIATQAMLCWLRAPVFDALPVSFNPHYRLRLLGLAAGGLLLAAGGLVHEHTWVGWAAAGLGGALLMLRRQVPVPGLWLGLLLAALGYQALQWEHLLPVGPAFRPGPVWLYLLPLLLLSLVGMGASWWAAAERHVRWPWLYLLGLQAAAASWIAFAPRTEALPVLLWTLLAAASAGAAHLARRRWSTLAALIRAGWPDRRLLHLTYTLLALALAVHFDGVFGHSAGQLLGIPARRLTAGALLLLLAGLAIQRPPATEPTYRSWRYFQPLLPELTLLFGCFTFGYELRLEWLALVWLALAFGLTLGAGRLPQRLRRVQAYGLLFFWAAVGWIMHVSFHALAPGQLLTVPWATTATAAALLFGYAAVRLQQPPAGPADWPPLLAPLAGLVRLPLPGLVGLLLYPAFVALTALLTQSFDRSVLTVLLMLEVVAAFVASLLLRRQDLRYAALLGMAAAVARLFFFDLRQTGTITRAVVFIMMGLLLLGMNALYARFKDRFAPADEPLTEPPQPESPEEALVATE
ncbi:hypothetical protein CDA63_17910 [Hymenobacter amundsenii]|uniref:DUF2339 domain-containing protein n=1 Tax=Hymenobacter amundsenii TaxID=2006685 RepID=A0A246FGR8_9BACT|nr:hypothetical protein [Hymenobacter amundsenii]OWP61737.1 hypothetical protein CDA63_17910 [Hymenobacter amundsenii]